MRDRDTVHSEWWAARQLVNKLKEELDRIDAVENAAYVAKYLPDYVGKEIYFTGTWGCPDSPVDDLCAYDEEEDSWHDHCLFCGNPTDRG